MPSTTAPEKINYMKALGATVELCRTDVPASDPRHFQGAARRKAAETPNSVFLNQFDNTVNSDHHYDYTAREIHKQLNGKVDGFVCAAGTGGTLSGCTRYFKEKLDDVHTWYIDPKGTGIVPDGIKYTPQGPFVQLRNKTDQEKERDASSGVKYTTIEGIGPGRLFGNLDMALLDGVFAMQSDREAIFMAHYVLQHDAIFMGASGGLNLLGAYLLAKRLGPGHTIVTVIADSGSRYMMSLYSKEVCERLNVPSQDDYIATSDSGKSLLWADLCQRAEYTIDSFIESLNTSVTP